MRLLGRVERFIKCNATSASRFGRQVLGDPNFVRDLRNGREPRPETAARVEAYLSGAGDAGKRPPCSS